MLDLNLIFSLAELLTSVNLYVLYFYYSMSVNFLCAGATTVTFQFNNILSHKQKLTHNIVCGEILI